MKFSFIHKTAILSLHVDFHANTKKEKKKEKITKIDNGNFIFF